MHDGTEGLRRDVAVDRVRRLRASFLTGRGVERVSIDGIDGIDGRVLVDELGAPADVPARDHATMDGFAFRAEDGYPLALDEGETYPEDDPPILGEGEAVRIATGAPLPARADVVLKREDATVTDGLLRGPQADQDTPQIDPGTHVRERASEAATGETLFEAGERLSPKDAALLADLGVDEVSVRERFSVGVLATGTEIHEGRSPDRDSAMLAGLVESWGHEATIEGSVPDEYERVESAIEAVASDHDVVVTSGGTSVGRKDHVVRALDDVGEVLFQGVRLRPGKPGAVARLADREAVALAFPGKPFAAHTAAVLVARPFFTGETALPTVDAQMARNVGVQRDGFEYAVPVTLSDGEAMPLGHADSALAVYGDTFDPSVLSSSPRATRADGLVVTSDALTAGESVGIVPYESLQ